MKQLLILLFLIISNTGQSQIPDYLPSDSLIGWWPFNGNAQDESYNGNNGVITGSSLTIDRFGENNRAFSFDGLGNKIEFTIGNFKKICISLWFKSATLQPSSYPTLFSYNQDKFSCGIQRVNNYPYLNNLRFYYTINNYGPNIIANDNIWHHLIVNLDVQNSNYSIFIDSVNVAQGVTAESPLLWVNQNILTLGNENTSNNFANFKGVIDDVCFWKRNLTPNEISNIFSSSTGNVGIGIQTPKRKLHVNDVLRLEPRNSPPDLPSKGDIYFDGTLNKLRVYDGTVWQNCW